MKLDRGGGFYSIATGKEPLIDPEMRGNWPINPLVERLSNVWALNDVNLPTIKVVEKIYSTGIYNSPLSFSEFKKLKYITFKTLATLNRTSILEQNLNALNNFQVLSAAAKAMGFLSDNEIKMARGGALPNQTGYLLDEDLEEYYEYGLSSNSEIGPFVLNDQEEAIKKIRMYQGLGFVVCISFGTFDMLNAGQQDTHFRANEIFGNNTIKMVGVSSRCESKIIKNKYPIRKQRERVKSMKLTKGVNISFPVKLPAQTKYKEELREFYSDLHIRMGANIRIMGNPNNSSMDSYAIYQGQCSNSGTLLIFNDNLINVSSTSDRERVNKSRGG